MRRRQTLTQDSRERRLPLSVCLHVYVDGREWVACPETSISRQQQHATADVATADNRRDVAAAVTPDTLASLVSMEG